MTILDMQVRLYTSPEQLAAGTPGWTGSLNDFWELNQDGYNFGEIRALGDELAFTGRHRGGGGAAAEFWLLRGDGKVAPKGWDVAGTSVGVEVRETPAAEVARLRLAVDELATELRQLADYYECYRQQRRDKVPSEAIARARALLAKHRDGAHV